MTTMSPRRRDGTRTSRTYAYKISVFVGSSMVMQAVEPSSRTEAIAVVVHQWPCGAWQTRRSPLGKRPRSRVMFVLAADSSDKD